MVDHNRCCPSTVHRLCVTLLSSIDIVQPELKIAPPTSPLSLLRATAVLDASPLHSSQPSEDLHRTHTRSDEIVRINNDDEPQLSVVAAQLHVTRVSRHRLGWDWDCVKIAAPQSRHQAEGDPRCARRVTTIWDVIGEINCVCTVDGVALVLHCIGDQQRLDVISNKV